MSSKQDGAVSGVHEPPVTRHPTKRFGDEEVAKLEQVAVARVKQR
jgi:hypothetical protein